MVPRSEKRIEFQEWTPGVTSKSEKGVKKGMNSKNELQE